MSFKSKIVAKKSCLLVDQSSDKTLGRLEKYDEILQLTANFLAFSEYMNCKSTC